MDLNNNKIKKTIDNTIDKFYDYFKNNHDYKKIISSIDFVKNYIEISKILNSFKNNDFYDKNIAIFINKYILYYIFLYISITNINNKSIFINNLLSLSNKNELKEYLNSETISIIIELNNYLLKIISNKQEKKIII